MNTIIIEYHAIIQSFDVFDVQARDHHQDGCYEGTVVNSQAFQSNIHPSSIIIRHAIRGT
jgi:hypothetical protein